MTQFWTYTCVDDESIRDSLGEGEDWCPRRLFVSRDAAKAAADEDWKDSTDACPEDEQDKLEWYEYDGGLQADLGHGMFYRVFPMEVVT